LKDKKGKSSPSKSDSSSVKEAIEENNTENN